MQIAPKTRNTNIILPWVILTLMTVYVFGLSFYSNNRETPEPEFDFYGTSQVFVTIIDEGEPQDSIHSVYGSYNNIIEGSRQHIEADLLDGQYSVSFKVNSPRSATLFINDEAIEIFLVPDSALALTVTYDWNESSLSVPSFTGYTSGICRYYVEKAQRFGRQHVRAYRTTAFDDSLERHAHVLDSLAVQELAYILIRSTANQLPDWFVDFEKNEILYQKAYLKLTNAYNREVYEGYLDEIPLQDESAVFCYYYYLYLQSFCQEHAIDKTIGGKMAVADSLLSGEVKDVFFTQHIFSLTSKDEPEQAQKLLKIYKTAFSKKKYERFLQKQLEKG